jgi:hypothetical protein
VASIPLSLKLELSHFGFDFFGAAVRSPKRKLMDDARWPFFDAPAALMLSDAMPVMADVKIDVGILAMFLDAFAVEPAIKASLHHLSKGFAIQNCAFHVCSPSHAGAYGVRGLGGYGFIASLANEAPAGESQLFGAAHIDEAIASSPKAKALVAVEAAHRAGEMVHRTGNRLELSNG